MFNNKSFDKNFSKLLEASSFHAAAKIIGIASGFFASLLIAREYGADLVGKVATITSIFSLLTLFSLLGNKTLIVKSLPQHIEQYDYSAAKQVYFQLLKITAYLTLTVVVLWHILERTTPLSIVKGLEQYTILITALIIASSFKQLNTKALRGLGDYKIYSCFEILLPILLALSAVIAIIFGFSENLFQYFYFLPIITVGILSFYFVDRTFSQKLKQNDTPYTKAFKKPSSSSLIRTSFPMFGVTISTAIIAHFDILMLNYFTTSNSVGVYSIYAKIVMLSTFATQSINSMFAPSISRLFSSDQLTDLKYFAKKTTLLSFTCSLMLTITVLIFHKPLLGFYGDDFLQDLPTLYVLLLSSLVSSFFGSVGLYLNMTGHQTHFFRIMLLAAIMNIVFNMLLIPLLGALGAALATLFSVFTWNILATRKIFVEFNYTLLWSGSSRV